MDLILKALMKSEHDYFSAGSHNRKILSGEMSVTPKFESLASGCVLHDIQESNIDENLDKWLNSVEEEFKKAGAALCRFYLPQKSNIDQKLLIARGYQKVTEVGLAVCLEDVLKKSNNTQGTLKCIEGHEGWIQKKHLYQLAMLGPDGHDMHNGSFAELEKIKCDTGYMISYLYWKDDKPVGAVSLAIKDKFARLKNLLVHPDYRNQGVGWEIVLNLMHESLLLGAKNFGVYAVEKMYSHKLYLGCRMKEVLRHTEWSRELK